MALVFTGQLGWVEAVVVVDDEGNQIYPLNLTNAPAVNSAANLTAADVVGNKEDTWQGDSLYAQAMLVARRYYAETLVYPTLAASAAIASVVGLWTWGNYATVVPAAAITADFHLLAVQIEACDQDGVFEFEIYQGPADDLIAAFRLVVEGGFYGNVRYALSAEPVAGGSQIRARVAGGNGLVTNLAMSIEYNTLP